MTRSVEIPLYAYCGRRLAPKSSFEFGFGLLWRNFTQTGKDRLVWQDGEVVAGTFPEESYRRRSRLSIFSLSFPLLYSHAFSDDFGFAVGPVIDWNVKSVLKNKYRLDGDGHKKKYKYVDVNPVTVDFMLQIHTWDFSWHVRYSPFDLMDSNGWQGMGQQLTVGIML